MHSEIAHEILQFIESKTNSRPTAMEFEMAYQARVAIDRIKSAIRHAERLSNPCDQMRKASLQLLEALERLECMDRRFQLRSRAHRRGDAA